MKKYITNTPHTLMQVFRRIRMKAMRVILEFQAVAFKPTSAKCVILLPHPDDEVFGMGGTIAAKISAGAECVFVLATLGENSHSDCCPGTKSEVMLKRRAEFYRSLSALGLRHPLVIELGLVDGGILALSESENVAVRNKIALILSEVLPQEVYYPARQDSHPDHSGMSRLCFDAVAQSRVKCREFRYIVWGWLLPSKNFYKELFSSKVITVDAQPWAENKRRAIDAYVKAPPAPCGVPYSGQLPEVLVEACSSVREFYLL